MLIHEQITLLHQQIDSLTEQILSLANQINSESLEKLAEHEIGMESANLHRELRD